MKIKTKPTRRGSSCLTLAISLVTLLVIGSVNVTVNAANTTDLTSSTATATATGRTSISVTMPYGGDDNANNTYTVEYKKSSDGSWSTWVSGAAHTASPYTTTITGLLPYTSYDVRATYNDTDGITGGTNPQTISGVTTAWIDTVNDWTGSSFGVSAVSGSVNINSQTISAGTDRLVLVAVASEGLGAGTTSMDIPSVTFGSQTVTPITESGSRDFCYMGYLKEADIPSGAQTLTVSYSSGGTQGVSALHVYWACYQYVDQTTPTNDWAGNNAASTTVTFGSQVDYVSRGVTVFVAENGANSATITSPSGFVTVLGQGVNNHQSYICQTAPHTSAGNYAGTSSVTFSGTTARSAVVAASLKPDKITPTLQVDNSPVTYNGSSQAATVSASAAGTVSNVKYNGSSTTPTNAGTYAITADFAPTDTTTYNSLTGASAGNFVINKATPTATLAVNNSPVTYDGTPKAATVGISSSSVSGTVANVLTDGAATQTAVGTYPVTADFVPDDSDNYNSLTGLSAGSFVINKADPTVMVTVGSYTFDGTSQGPDSYTTSPSGDTGSPTWSYVGTGATTYGPSATPPTEVGTYDATVSLTADASFNAASSSATAFTIDAADSTVLERTTATATVAGRSSISVTMPYEGDDNANNTYTVEYKKSSEGSWTTWVSAAAHTASPYTTTITGLESMTNYDVRVTYNDADGVTGGTNPQTITSLLTPWIDTVNAWTNTSSTAPFDSGGTVNIDSQTVSAGTNRLLVVAVATETDGPNTTAMDVSATFGGVPLTTVAKSGFRDFCYMGYLKESDIPSGANSLAITYSSTGQNVSALDVYWACYQHVDQTSPINDSVGNYSSEGVTETVTFGEQVDYVWRGATVFVAENGNGAADITTPTDFATVLGTQANGQTSYICETPPHTTAGNYADTEEVTFSGGTKRSALVVASLKPDKIASTIQVNNSPVTYNGSAQTATFDTSTAGSVSNVKYNGSATTPTDAGTYAVTADFTPSDTDNYETLTDESAGNFVIEQAGTSVTVGSTSQTNGYKDSVSFTATLPASATGNVTFLTNGVAFSVNAISSGTATSDSTALLPRGTNTVTAGYAGDANYVGSTNVLVGGQVVTNHPPSVINTVTYTRSAKTSYKISISQLLSGNVTDFDDDTVSFTGVNSPSTNGANVWVSGGYILYTNSANVDDSFTYTVNDGVHGGTGTGTILMQVIPVVSSNTIVRLQVGVPGPNSNTISLAGIPNYQYVLQFSTNMTDWENLSTNPAGSNGQWNVIDDTATNSTRYYRSMYQ